MLASLNEKVRTWLRGVGLGSTTPELEEPIEVVDQAKIENIQTVCLFLGPYRNLTTLTASLLYLHPHAQVLNHAGKQVLSQPELNFLADNSPQTFHRFCHFAVQTSLGGRRGKRGGSLTFSHAFAEHDVMQATYHARYGETLLKPSIRNLVWKDSLRIQNFIQERGIDVASLADQHPKLRFLMPIRNPLDCAVSIKAKGFVAQFKELRGDSLEDILRAVIREMVWVFRQQRSRPDRVFTFFQQELDEERLRQLAVFLELDAERRWLDDALTCLKLKPAYDHAPELTAYYRGLVAEYLEEFPELIGPFLDFVER